MSKFKIEEYFNYKSVTPSSLQQDNVIQFSYKSPKGVHDETPLVLITEKLVDRCYGINIHYDMSELNEIVTNIENELLPFLEKEYYKKYPDNKKKLQEQRIKFNKSLITEQEYHEMMNRFPKRDLEVFRIQNYNLENMRCYLYKRMTSVSKLIWKS